MSGESLRLAAWAGLQDSMPRAALLSLHARVADTPPTVLDDPALIQVWGPRYSAYAVPSVDMPIFTLARLPDDDKGRRRAEEMADRLDGFLAGRRMKDREVHAALETGNSIRYATTTGRIAIRWEGALAPWVWTVPRPEMTPAQARLEMARRYLHVFGPTTAAAFAEWAGISGSAGPRTFAALGDELVPATTPIGDAWLLASDEAAMRAPAGPAASRPAAAQWRHILPALGPRSRAARPGCEASSGAVDLARVARRSTGRWPGRGRVAPVQREGRSRHVASAVEC